jgi:hypothetical protein
LAQWRIPQPGPPHAKVMRSTHKICRPLKASSYGR